MELAMSIRNAILCAVLVGFNLMASSAFAESSVWKVSKGENYFYLGGTIHLLSAADHPLPDEFNLAYNDAGKIFFETDLAATKTPEFQSKFIAAMMYSDDRTLQSELDPAIYRKLESFMTSRHMPIAQFSKFQPWGVSMMIVLFEYQRLGMMPNYGVDAYFNSLAVSDNKIIMSLETPDEQINFLRSMAKIDQDIGVEYTLRDLKRLPEFIDSMKQNWRSGDLEALAESIFVAQMQREFPELYDSIVTSRNNAWMRQLPRLTDDSEREFVLVGAMHLYGKEGLLNQLALQGFSVEQL
ncbi:conjugative transfer protein GumN [Marinobacterium zhoushanense]|uniref:Conjugative transfer protein GumN n=2 Tax=Marinobacterium zhoushanense TaxID=1679163 RepID=A0ABQ1KSQ4_9GAMM|nr:conjugative transfer protein GumN [Marinobacterium zhoushanense]